MKLYKCKSCNKEKPMCLMFSQNYCVDCIGGKEGTPDFEDGALDIDFKEAEIRVLSQYNIEDVEKTIEMQRAADKICGIPLKLTMPEQRKHPRRRRKDKKLSEAFRKVRENRTLINMIEDVEKTLEEL